MLIAHEIRKRPHIGFDAEAMRPDGSYLYVVVPHSVSPDRVHRRHKRGTWRCW